MKSKRLIENGELMFKTCAKLLFWTRIEQIKRISCRSYAGKFHEGVIFYDTLISEEMTAS